MEQDLGTSLEWVAGDHFNTLAPHTHLVIRGKDDHGADLVIAPEYIRRGMSERLGGLISIDLGPPCALEVERRLRAEVRAERLTSIDRELIRDVDPSRTLRPLGRDMFEHSMRTGRLRKLGRLGLAEDLRDGRWRLDEQLEPVLRALEERSEILQRMQRILDTAGLERAPSQQLIYDLQNGHSIVGCVIASSVDEDARETAYLIVDGTDGRTHYVGLGGTEAVEPLPRHAIARVSAERTALAGTEADLFADAKRQTIVKVELLSPLPLKDLVHHDGATWLDQILLSAADQSRDSGFGQEVRSALRLRNVWLMERGLAVLEDGSVSYNAEMLAMLERRELQRVATVLSAETGLQFIDSQTATPIEGQVRSRHDLACGRFACVQYGSQFTLVPWRPELGRATARDVGEMTGWRREPPLIPRGHGLDI